MRIGSLAEDEKIWKQDNSVTVTDKEVFDIHRADYQSDIGQLAAP